MIKQVKHFPGPEKIAATAALPLPDALASCSISQAQRNIIFRTSDNCIGYVDPVTCVPSFTMVYPYITAFTYLFCVDRGSHDIRVDDIVHHLALQPLCGGVLYSAIPRLYKYTFGMSGTLDCLSDSQETMLNQFDLHTRTYLSSTFQKQALIDYGILFHHGSEEEYFHVSPHVRELSLFI